MLQKKNKQEVDKLHSLVEKFWETEDVPKPLNKFSEEEQNCENHFTSTVKLSPANRIIVKLPFKEPKVELGDSYEIALGRFLNLEKKLIRNSELKKDASCKTTNGVSLNETMLVGPTLQP